MKLRNKKTGEVFDALIREKGGGDTYSIIVCDIKAYNQSKSTLDATHFILDEYDSLSKLNEEWEDYKPAEPLIKDEKIRKAVRAWAELYDNSVIRVHLGEDFVSLFKDEVNGYSSSVGIDLPPDVFRELIDTHYYTITELCGEEEE